MHIICAKCGRYFSSIDAAQEHRGPCGNLPESAGHTVRWIPSQDSGKARVSSEEWSRIVAVLDSPSSQTEDELAAYLHPDGSFEQSDAYAQRVRKTELEPVPGTGYCADEYRVEQDRMLTWVVIGLLIFIVGLVLVVLYHG